MKVDKLIPLLCFLALVVTPCLPAADGVLPFFIDPLIHERLPWLESAEAGNRLFEEGDMEGAVREWEKAVELGFTDGYAFFYLGRHYALREDWEKAIRYLRQARPRLDHLETEEAMIPATEEMLGLAYLNTGQYFESYLHYRRALRLVPDSPSVHLGLAHLNIHRGRLAEAERWAEQALELSPESPRASLIMALAAERRGDYREAVDHFRAYLEGEPEDWRVRLSRGLLLAVRLGRDREAERELDIVVSLQPGQAEARAVLGEIYLRRGEEEEAAAAARRSLEADGENYRALTLLGRLRLQEGDMAGAEPHFREAYRIEPEGAMALYGMGVIGFDRGDYEEAEDYFRRALARVPSFPEAALNRGLALEVLGRREEALRVLADLVESHPEFASGHLGLGRIRYYSGDREAALPFFRNALALDPAAWEPYYFIGKCLWDRGRRKEALEYYLTARRRGGDAPALLADIARAREEAGELELAEAALEEALAADSNYLPALLQLSRLKARREKGEDAQRLYRQALIIRPGEASWDFAGEERAFLAGMISGLEDYLGGGIDYLSLFALLRNLSRERKLFQDLTPVLEDRAAAHPSQPRYAHLLGLAYLEEGDLEKAERQFRRALNLDSDFAAAHFSLGDLYGRTGRPEQARRHLAAVLLLSPGSSVSPEVRRMLGDLPE